MFYLSRVGLHHWEEPPISGERGSGAVFFSGCTLRCVYCQNYKISRSKCGIAVEQKTLIDLMLYLQKTGAHNINLVSPSLYISSLPKVLKDAKKAGLTIPVVYNTHAYETVESLKRLEGLVDIYLPDFKYSDDELAYNYSKAKNYSAVARRAISEMRRQQPKDLFDESGIMKKGVIIRHLVLPGGIENSEGAFKKIAGIDKSLYVSVMSQYFPSAEARNIENLNRRVTEDEYSAAISSFFDAGLSNGFMQEPGSAIEYYVPDFDLSQLKQIIDNL